MVSYFVVSGSCQNHVLPYPVGNARTLSADFAYFNARSTITGRRCFLSLGIREKLSRLGTRPALRIPPQERENRIPPPCAPRHFATSLGEEQGVCGLGDRDTPPHQGVVNAMEKATESKH